MEDDAELLLERVEEEMAEDYSEEEDGYNHLAIMMMIMIVKMMVMRMTSTITPPNQGRAPHRRTRGLPR